jgi:dTDP-4-amino-4,6-dideoxygalactose transaminase
MRKKAANLKRQFVNNDYIGNKEFLEIFNKAEELLEEDYENYILSDEDCVLVNKLDNNKITTKRQGNAEYLTENLKDINGIECIRMTEGSTPLFVPIIVMNGQRDKLRDILKDNQIYCPVHWPLSKLHTIENVFLYRNSLSLICDQRYSVNDMEKIVTIIKKFYY